VIASARADCANAPIAADIIHAIVQNTLKFSLFGMTITLKDLLEN